VVDMASEALGSSVPLLHWDCLTHQARIDAMMERIEMIAHVLDPTFVSSLRGQVNDIKLKIQNELERLDDPLNPSPAYNLNFSRDNPDQDIDINVTPFGLPAPDQLGTPTKGRPRKAMNTSPRKVLQGRVQGYRLKSIAEMSGCSRTTLWRRLKESANSADAWKHTQLSDQELDETIAGILDTRPNSGIRLIQGALRSSELLIPETRIRSSIKRVDPTRGFDHLMAKIPKRIPYQVSKIRFSVNV